MLLFLLSALVSSICDLPSDYEFTDFEVFVIGSLVNFDPNRNPECIPRYREQVKKGNHYYDWRVNYLINNETATIDFEDMIPYDVRIYANDNKHHDVNIKWQSNNKDAKYDITLTNVDIQISGDSHRPLSLNQFTSVNSNFNTIDIDSRPGVVLNTDAFGFGGNVGKYEKFFSAVYFYFQTDVTIDQYSMKYSISIFLKKSFNQLPMNGINEKLKIIVQTSSYQIYRKSTDCTCAIFVPYLMPISISSQALIVGLDSNHPPNFPDQSNPLIIFSNPSSILFLDNSAPKHVNALFRVSPTYTKPSLYFQGSDPSVSLNLGSMGGNLYFLQANTYLRYFYSTSNVNLINENGNMAYVFIPVLNSLAFTPVTKNIALVVGSLNGYSNSDIGNIPIKITNRIKLEKINYPSMIELKEYSIIDKPFEDVYRMPFNYQGSNYFLKCKLDKLSYSSMDKYQNHTIFKSYQIDLKDFVVSFRDFAYYREYYFSKDLYNVYRIEASTEGSTGQWSGSCVKDTQGDNYYAIDYIQTRPFPPKELELTYYQGSNDDYNIINSDWKRVIQYPETKRIKLTISTDYAIPDSFNLDNTVYTNIDLQVRGKSSSSSTPRTFNLDVTNIGNRIRTLTLNSIKLVITGGKKNNDLIDLNFESLVLDSSSTIDEGTIERCNFNNIKRVELPYGILKYYAHKFEACDSVSVIYTDSSMQAEIRIAPSLATIQYDSSSSSKNELFINLKQSESYTFSYKSAYSTKTLKLIKGTSSKTNAKSVLIPFNSNLEFPYTFSDEDVIEIKPLSLSSISISITMPTDKFTTFITPRMRFNDINSAAVNIDLGYIYSSLVFNPVYSEVQLTFNIQSNMPGNVVFNELELVNSGICVVKYSSNYLKYQVKRLKLNNNYNRFDSTNVQIGTLDLYGSASIKVTNLRSANLSSPAGLITMHNKGNKFPSMSLEKDSNPNQLRPSSIRIDISASNWDYISDSVIWMYAHPDDTFNVIPHNDYVTKTNIVYGPTTDFDCNKWISIVSINNPVVNVQGVEFEYSLRCTRANYSTNGFDYDEESNSFYQYSYLELISRVLSVTDSFDHAEVVNKTLSGGAIAGISISVIIVVAVIVGLIIFFVILKKCHHQRENSDEEGKEKEEINEEEENNEKEEERQANEESESN